MATQADFLTVLERHRVASVSQLSVLLSTSPQMIRRWVRASDVRVLAGLAGRGRPEQWITLRSYKADTLAHDWHVTAVAVQVVELTKTYPEYSYSFLPAAFPGLVPDLAFVLSRGSRSCLFFVEVDMGTEPLTRRGAGSDLLGKLWRYLELRATNRYHHCILSSTTRLHGFRVLLVGLFGGRLTEVCRSVQKLPGNFVWVETRNNSESHHFHDRVWLKGGVGAPQALRP
jgi:hypothetical protein